MVLGALAVVGILRRPAMVLTLTVTVAVIEVSVALSDLSPSYDVGKMLSFVPLFLTGALLYLYRERIPDSGLLALALLGIFLVGCWLPLGGPATIFSGDNNGPALLAPALAYPVLWLGVHLPFQRIGSRNDYSYGMYIYAFPIQILLVIWGLNRWGEGVYTVLCIVATFPAAMASWWLVERNALRLKAFSPTAVFRRHAAVSGGTPGSGPPTPHGESTPLPAKRAADRPTGVEAASAVVSGDPGTPSS